MIEIVAGTVIVLAAVALLVAAISRVRRNRKFVEETRTAILCTPLGARQGDARASVVDATRKNIPNLLLFNTLYWETDWDTIRAFIDRYEIPVAEMPKHTRGKIARWMAGIVTAKYAIDLDRRLLFVEDDVELPPDFDFSRATLLLRKYDFVKLAKWGEAYLFNPRGAEKYIEKVYEFGIHTHCDEFIKEHVSEFTRRMIEAGYVKAPKNEGNILDTPAESDIRNIHLDRIGTNAYLKLINDRIFKDGNDNPCDMPGILRAHLHGTDPSV